ncbi:palmitoyltransferase ZDHHC12-B isoform X2 [Austrofundulus limnaeus]|uniref:Palmitoyltransferase ZDHHC12-B isoform X2 n=1 Tax=Austrofundulus limnaeus TaxID=52670 RepID=A0A2I4AIT5_AUSLI|nr:PREDICTED: uncharacterized protein LOC106511191 isoform X2 [Austrofundulus limnaeus]
MFKNVFGSGFLVRTAHVVLTWVVTLILFLHDTELRKQEETGQLVQPVLFVLLVLVSVLLYFTVSLMDPGFILSDDPDLQSGGVGGAAGHDRPRVQIPASAPLWSLSAAAANEVEALSDVSSLRAEVRPSLPVDRELCGGAEPPLVRGLPGGPAAGSGLGPAHHLDRPGSGPRLVSVAAVQRGPAGGPGAAGAAGPGGPAPAGVSPVPGLPEHHHLGVHVPPPHLLPEALRRRAEPLRPRDPAQPVGVLLRVGVRGLGAGLLQGGQRPRLGFDLGPGIRPIRPELSPDPQSIRTKTSRTRTQVGQNLTRSETGSEDQLLVVEQRSPEPVYSPVCLWISNPNLELIWIKSFLQEI